MTQTPLDAPTLDQRQRNTLQVLGYLFLRMGRHTQAKRLFTALLALDPRDLLARRCLAAACLSLGEGEEALQHLTNVMEAGPLSSRDAALHLLKAQALWLCARPEEARTALRTYITSMGGEA